MDFQWEVLAARRRKANPPEASNSLPNAALQSEEGWGGAAAAQHEATGSKRGRPVGTFGSREVRSSLRQRLAEDAADVPAEAPAPTVVHGDFSPQPCARQSGCLVSELCSVGTALQKKLFGFARSQMVRHALPNAPNPAQTFLRAGSRPLSSLASLAIAADLTNETVAGRAQQRVACAALESSGFLWSGLLQKVRTLVQRDGCEARLCVLTRSYDETPLKLRFRESAVPVSPLAQLLSETQKAQGGVAAKLLQTKLGLSFLLFSPEQKRYLQICGQVPSCLQVMEKGTASLVKQCQTQLWSILPELKATADMFDLKLRIPCTDRHPSNIAAERSMQSDDPSWVSAHMLCNIHRVASAEKATAELLDSHLSGMQPRVPRQPAKVRKKKKRIGGGGGAWRAFLSDKYKGLKLTKFLLVQASAVYRALKAEHGQSWEMYKNLGEIATCASREGVKLRRSRVAAAKPDFAAAPSVVAPDLARMLQDTMESVKVHRAERAQAIQKQEEVLQQAQARAEGPVTGQGLASVGEAAAASSCFSCSIGGAGRPALAEFAVPADNMAQDRSTFAFYMSARFCSGA